ELSYPEPHIPADAAQLTETSERPSPRAIRPEGRGPGGPVRPALAGAASPRPTRPPEAPRPPPSTPPIVLADPAVGQATPVPPPAPPVVRPAGSQPGPSSPTPQPVAGERAPAPMSDLFATSAPQARPGAPIDGDPGERTGARE